MTGEPDVVWENGGRLKDDPKGYRLGRAASVRIGHAGENQTMENALLGGLSRQMTLERQIDVIANNIANVNTTGYKADQSLFEEYLTSGAHEDNFVGHDRRVSYVHARGACRGFTQGGLQQPANPLDFAISG